MTELPQRQPPKLLPPWRPLPPSRTFEPRRSAVTPLAHQYISEACTIEDLRAIHRWEQRHWGAITKVAFGACLEALLCDLALLPLEGGPDAPKFLTVETAAVAEAQTSAPETALSLFPDAYDFLIGHGLIELNSHGYRPEGHGEMGFGPCAELLEIVTRLGLQADDFGLADCSPRERAVVWLP